MTAPDTEPVPRLRVLAYEYEARKGDLLIEADGSTIRIVKVTADDAGADLTLADDTVRHYGRGSSLDLFRDMRELPEGFRDYDPSIVA